MQFKLSDIKIVIWDLDDTFWHGTLSEGAISAIPQHIQLVKDLTDRGIINSICSKNDFDPTFAKLKELDIADYFVFPSINWLPKGERIKNTLSAMGLRPQNCLFIDDNIVNLEEAKHANPGIMTMLPDGIAELIKESDAAEPTDIKHKRLKQYRVLEEKTEAAKEFSDNTEFLFSSNIRVEIHRDCISQLDRIAELVLRSNQLNFTKLRSTKAELQTLIDDPDCDCGYVTVRDNFGDYGMVGFFAVKNRRCIHLLFSCRTIGSGVEEYVYATLGHPELVTVEPVINHLGDAPAPKWINQAEPAAQQQATQKQHCKVIFKGGCDLGQMREYLISDSVIEEFTYMGKLRGNNIEHRNHSVNYLQWHNLDNSSRKELVDTLIFNDEEMFDTQMYDNDVALLVLSTMVEPNLGIYRNKTTGFEIAFGESSHPLTHPQHQQLYMAEHIFTASNKFTPEWLAWFTENYSFEGNLSPEQILANAKKTLRKVNQNAKVAFILGPEIEFLNETQQHYANRHHTYARINKLFHEWAKQEPRVLLIA